MIIQNWWFTTLLEHKYKVCPPLQKDIECDVLIIGGGMSGISAAAAFINKGLNVVVIEKNIIEVNKTIARRTLDDIYTYLINKI